MQHGNAVTRKADEIESLLLTHFWQETPGWLMTFVSWPEMRRLRKEDFEGQTTDPPDLEACRLPAAHILYTHEDTMACTGNLLGGLARKLQIREDPASRDLADRCVRGLYRVFELGLEIEKGFTPKPYGGKCSRQFSPDNWDSYAIGLGAYYPIAGSREKAMIQEILCESAAFWIRHRHACPFPYFQHGTWDLENDPDEDGHWPLLFMPVYRLCADISDDPIYAETYERLKSKFLKLGQADDIAIKAGSYHRWIPQLAALMEWAPENRDLWLKGLEQWRRILFVDKRVGIARGKLHCGEGCARWLNDADLANYIARDIANLTQEQMIYAYQWLEHDPTMFPKNDPSAQVFWKMMDGWFMSETYFACWDGRIAGLWD